MQNQKQTLLVVDDEEMLRDAIAFDFRRKGYQVFVAGSGNEALELVKKEEIHLVLSDVRMPNGSGIDLLNSLKKLEASPPAMIFLTGFADISLEQAYDMGAEAVFPKPFDRKALHQAVVRALVPLDQKYKRKEGRVDADLEVGLRFSSGRIDTTAKLSNLGRGGCFLELDYYPGLGESVEFSLAFEGEHQYVVQGKGVIRWVRGPESALPAGCGMEFTELNEVYRKQVLGLINFLKTKSYIPLR